MRLLLIGPLPPPLGGATVLFRLLVDELKQHREGAHHCEVINTVGRSKLGVFFELLKMGGKSDVISYHASSKNFVLGGALVVVIGRLLRKKVVVRVFGGNLLETIESLGFIGRLSSKIVLCADVVLVEMKALRDKILKLCPNADVQWFPNSRAFDRSLVRPLPVLETGVVRFGFFGHVRAEKGVRELVEAFRKLPTGTPCELHIYGRVFSSLDVKQLSLSRDVYFHGEVSSVEVLDKMSLCDVVVLPTWYQGEGYPGTLIEAFTVGRCVVATDWRFIPEVVRHDVNGLLVPPRDAQSLAGALLRIVDDRELLVRLAADALDSAQFFSSSYWNGEFFVDICRGGAGS